MGYINRRLCAVLGLVTITFIYAQDSKGNDTTKVFQTKATIKAHAIYKIKHLPELHIFPSLPVISTVDSLIANLEKDIVSSINFTLDTFFIKGLRVHNRLLKVPLQNSIVKESLIIRIPNRRLPLKKWFIVIYDFQGNKVKMFQGKGNFPEFIIWNGVTDNIKIAIPGEPYTVRAFGIDKNGFKTGTLWLTTLSFKAIKAHLPKGDVLSIDAKYIFSEDSGELKPDAYKHLTDVLNFIKDHFNQKIDIIIYANEEDVARMRIETLRNFILQRVLIQKNLLQIRSQLQMPGAPVHPRIEVFATRI